MINVMNHEEVPKILQDVPGVSQRNPRGLLEALRSLRSPEKVVMGLFMVL